MSRAPLILASLCCALLACGERPACSETPCGTIVVVTAADASGLFPPLSDSEIDRAVSDLIFLKLAEIGPARNTFGDSGFIPRLARSWRFNDSLTLTFNIDPRARWQDGVPVTAEDVAFTFALYRDPKVNAPARPLLDRIAGVTATDDHTVVFTFRQPYVEQFYDATYHMRVMPRHLVDSIPRNRIASHPLVRAPIGNGPYRLVDWKANASIELDADTAFFLGRPGLARIIWKVTPDPGTAVTQVLADEADAIQYLGAPENADRARAAPHLRVIEYPSMAYVYVALNLRDPVQKASPHWLFGTRDVRRALTQAIDRQTVMQAAYGGKAIVPAGPMSQLSAFVRDTTIPHLTFDTAAARETLARLGWRDSNGDGILDRAGRPLRFDLLIPGSSQTRNNAAVIIQAQFKRVGVEARIERVDFPTFLERTGKRRYDAAIIAWNEDPTPAGIHQSFVTSAIDNGANYVAYSNPDFDNLVSRAMDARNAAEGQQLWRQAYGVINQDAPGIWYAAPLQVTAVHKRLQNVSFRPEQWAADLWTWRVTPGQTIPRDGAAPATSAH